VRKLFGDTWVIYTRCLRLTLREPVLVAVGMATPVYFVVLFGPLWEKSLRMSNEESYATFLPGIFIEIAVFGTLFAGIALVSEVRAGLIERMRVTPVSRLALLLGRCARDISMLLVQACVLVAISIPFGLPFRPIALLLTLALMAMVALVATSVSYAVAMMVRSETALAGLANLVNVPFMLLSGILIPIAFAPDWLRWIAGVNPVYHAVRASRLLFAGELTDPAILRALLVVFAVGVVAAGWAARRFARDLT
jgi:ABC-2 type transport system permease protein